jgi:hypothetical protein
VNLIQIIQIATVGWRTAVPPEERIALLDQVDAWVCDQRRIALAQQRHAEPHAGPGVHRAREAR